MKKQKYRGKLFIFKQITLNYTNYQLRKKILELIWSINYKIKTINNETQINYIIKNGNDITDW
jgi:hypothetical protein